mgnify:CR=1 FL=1
MKTQAIKIIEEVKSKYNFKRKRQDTDTEDDSISKIMEQIK